MRITVVGAGPGGLVTALAARQRGLDVQVLEQAPALRAVGAGIVLQINALRMLASMGLDAEVIAAGAVLEEGRIETASGTVLKRIDLRPQQARHGQPAVAIHRATLSAILAEKLPAGTITYNARVRWSDGRLVAGEGGDEVAGDVVVGADGLHSEVRCAIVGEVRPRYAGYTCWRGISDASPLPPGLSCERWGRGQRFGIVPVGVGRTYWFGTEGGPEGGADPDDPRDALVRRFAAFGPPVADVLRATSNASILRNDIVDLPPLARWWKDRCVLLGDAAHAMTPNLGQGACQAVEDAVVLVSELSRAGGDRTTAFVRYAELRMARAHAVQALSDRMGAVGQWASPLGTVLRNLAFRAVPTWFVARSLDRLYAIEVPLP